MSDEGNEATTTRGERAGRARPVPREEYRIKMWKEVARLSGDRLRQQTMEPAPVEPAAGPSAKLQMA
jgi:hypothetical protein